MSKQPKNFKIKFIPKSSEERDLRIFKALSMLISEEDILKYFKENPGKSKDRMSSMSSIDKLNLETHN